MTKISANQGTIMVVDDNVENLNLVSTVLENAGYRVLAALSGEVALKAMAGSLPDLILLDVRMPGMDGYTVCRQLKLDLRARDVPIVFISANQRLSDRIAAFDAGAVDYVTKPICEEEILARVRSHVQLGRDRLHLEELVSIRTRELSESEAQLRELSVYLQRIREEDRMHFARELHDELGQNLTAMRMDFNALAHTLTAVDPGVVARLHAIDELINSTVDATRRICEELRPGMLDDLGLEAALSNYAKRFSSQFGVACELSMDREDYGLNDTLSTAIFRIVQESLTNVARHAAATHAMVALEDRGQELVLTIADDGRGLPALPNGGRKRFGLMGMRERVKMLGGDITIDSAAGRGTHIEVIIPGFRENFQ